VSAPCGGPSVRTAYGGKQKPALVATQGDTAWRGCSQMLVRSDCVVTADLKPWIGCVDLLTAGSFRLSMTLDRMGVG
jgi:hypothetical protein